METAMLLSVGALFCTGGVSFVFDSPISGQAQIFRKFYFAFLASFAVSILFWFFFHQRQQWRRVGMVSAIATLLCIFGLGYSVFHSDGFQPGWVTVWFISVASLFLFGKRSLRPHSDGVFFFINALFVFLGALLLFSISIFPHIKSSWLGGSPVPVVLYFSQASRVSPGQYLQAELLDETDAGYYIVSKSGGKAIFVPRGFVSVAYFSEDLPDPKLVSPSPR